MNGKNGLINLTMVTAYKEPKTLNDIDVEDLAMAITKIASSLETLNKSPLKQRTIAYLLKAMPGMSTIPLSHVEIVLKNASQLEKFHLKEKKAIGIGF